MPTFVVERTQPTVYLDKAGRPVQGYAVYVLLTEFDELHEVRVPSLSPDIVQAAVELLLEQRAALAALGA